MFLESFKDYLATTKLTFSYKPVLVLTLLDVVDRYGKASHAMLIGRFHAFYLERQRQGLPPEKERILYPSPLIKPDEVSDAQVWQILVRYPLELMDEFISVNEDYVRIKSALWSQMTAADLIELKEIALRRIQAYYDDNG
jgi:hypothetical protein